MPRTTRLFAAPLVLILLLAGGAPAAAQSVHPDVELLRPAPSVRNGLDALQTPEQPRVALLFSRFTSALSPEDAEIVDAAVDAWELLLLGLEVPYRVLEDSALAFGVPAGVRVLILPAAVALSVSERDTLQAFLAGGGGIVASDRVGYLDETGAPQGGRFFERLFGAVGIEDVPDQPTGLLHTIDAGTPPTSGLPAGFLLNLAPQTHAMAARPVTGRAMGRPVTYALSAGASRGDPFAGTTYLLHGTHGRGRFVWMRFNPQDVSPEAGQQIVYQGLVLGALAYTARLPSAALRPWPDGYPSATVLAALPLIGHTPLQYASSLNHTLDALETTGTTATFFLTTGEAAYYPDLMARIGQSGELAISADTDDVLVDEPLDRQAGRLREARDVLRSFAGAPVAGLYPPGGYYDEGTLRAMHGAGLRYVLESSVTVSAQPRYLDWTDIVDFRDSLASTGGELPDPAAADPDRLLLIPMTGRTIDAVGNTPEAQLQAYRADFERVHEARGLFIYPFHPETQALTPQRAAFLRQLAVYSKERRSWVTTLRDVDAWWRRRQAITFDLQATENELLFAIDNPTGQPLEGAALDVYWPGAEPSAVRVSGAAADVHPSEAGEGFVLVLPSLPPGLTQVRVRR